MNILVVEDEDLDRKLVMGDGLQFLNVELYAAVAGQADHPFTRPRDSSA